MKNKAFIIAISVVLALIIGISVFLLVTYANDSCEPKGGISGLVSSVKHNMDEKKPKDNISDYSVIKEDDLEENEAQVTDNNGNIISTTANSNSKESTTNNGKTPVVSSSETNLEKHFRLWSSNGANKLNKSYVQNALLVCKDQTGNKETDVILLLSANENTKQIYITPLLESSYSHYVAKNENKYDTFGAIFYNKGIAGLETVIENDYKITIGYNVVFQMEGISDIVNGYGGIKVESKDMDGSATLAYLRDASITPTERARRQGLVSYALIRKLQTETDSAVNTNVGTKALKYYTSSNSYISLANLVKRMSRSDKNYFAYNVKINNIYNSTYAVQAPAGKVVTYSNSSVVYIVDYIIASRDLQNLVYGSSIVVPSDNHKHPITLIQ